MTTAQLTMGTEVVASAEQRAAVVMLVESGELALGAAPRLGDWTMNTEIEGILILSPSPSDDEPIEDTYHSISDLERMFAS